MGGGEGEEGSGVEQVIEAVKLVLPFAGDEVLCAYAVDALWERLPALQVRCSRQ